jgi:hypothetical protein
MNGAQLLMARGGSSGLMNGPPAYPNQKSLGDYFEIGNHTYLSGVFRIIVINRRIA